ncbi:MAG: SulP family inorganic anion transporter [Egibacteraceae bacterium]
MPRERGGRLRRRVSGLLPILSWTANYERSALRGDLSAGVAVAVLLVPQSLAYAALAGMPPIAGLYAALVPLTVYAAAGSSRYVSVGPSAISSLLVASSLASYAGGDPDEYVALAGLLALLAGGIRLVLGVLRVGALANFLSAPVIGGFTSAAAIVIALGQIDDLLGISVDRSDSALSTLVAVAARLDATQLATLLVGAGSVALMVALRRLAPSAPAALVVTVAAIVAVAVFGLADAGVAVLREVPAGLPTPRLPALDPNAVTRLLPAALTLALVGYVEGISVAKELASRERQRIRPNQELFALGGACAAAGFFGGYPIGGSLSRTAINYESGASTQLASLVTAAIVALVLVALTPLLYFLPQATLAAIVIVAVGGLFDIGQARRAFRTGMADGLALSVTFLTTLFFPVEYGLLAGVAFSLAGFLYRSTYPHMAELGRVEGTDRYRKLARDEVRFVPEVALLRLDGGLYFMNAESFRDRVQALWAKREDLEIVILDTSAIVGIDATGIETLRALQDQGRARGIELHLATVRGPFRETLERVGLLDELTVHADVEAALTAVGH